ncbi:MAG TPA: CapA family protein, partial [Synergistaceae bacterium]|nr:CapA family protein [Synergistaceae bacterium]
MRGWKWVKGLVLVAWIGVGIVPGEGAPVRLSAVGDLMVHDPQIGAAWNEALQSYDFSPQISPLAPLLASADLTVGNLETTFGGPRRKYTGYPCFSTPDPWATALKDAG